MGRRRRPPKPVLVAVVVAQLVSSVLAWRDLNRRPIAYVRGSRRFWHVAMLLNPGNSVLYWLFGRRRG